VTETSLSSEQQGRQSSEIQSRIDGLKDWDQRQRFSLVAQTLMEIQSRARPLGKLRVVDIGSNVTSALESILPSERFEFFYADVFPADQALGVSKDKFFLLTPGAPLPFSTGEFDVAIAIDVLEHVQPEHVRNLVRELTRVASLGVVVTFPRTAQEVRAAEFAANEVYRSKWGCDHPFLIEHLSHGGVDEGLVVSQLREAGLNVFETDNSPLEIWPAALIATESLHHEGGAPEEFGILNDLIASTFDLPQRSYRKAFIAVSKKELSDLNVPARMTPNNVPNDRSESAVHVQSEILRQAVRRLHALEQSAERARRLERQLSLGVVRRGHAIDVRDADLVVVRDVRWDDALQSWQQTGPRPEFELTVLSETGLGSMQMKSSRDVVALRVEISSSANGSSELKSEFVLSPEMNRHSFKLVSGVWRIRLLPTPTPTGQFSIGDLRFELSHSLFGQFRL